MTIASMLLRAPHIGIRKFKANMSRLLKRGNPLVITERGIPIEVMIPYREAIEMIDLLDEATDIETLKAVREGRQAIKNGTKGIAVTSLFDKVHKVRK